MRLPGQARHCLLCLLSGLALPPLARAEPVSGQVVSVTAAEVYVSLGSRQGLQAGDPIVIHLGDGQSELRLPLADVSSSGGRALLLPSRRLPAPGDRVSASGRRRPATTSARVRQLPVPESQAALAERWRALSPPLPQPAPPRRASPPGEPPSPARLRGTLRLEYLGLLDLGELPISSYHQLGLWSELQVPHLLWRGLDWAHRFRLRFGFARDLEARPFQGARPTALLYQARLGLQGGRLRAELGRTQGAPLGESLVDGATLRARLTPWLYLGAFGGLAPRLLDLRPSLDSGRFGAYGSLRLASAPGRARAWSLAADLAFLGSTWEAALDRKAGTARLSLEVPPFSVHGLLTVDFYGQGHPAALEPADLTESSLELAWQLAAWLRAGLRFDRYRLLPTRETLAWLGADFGLRDPVSSGRLLLDFLLPRDITLAADLGLDHAASDDWALWGELSTRVPSLLRSDDGLRLALLGQRSQLLSALGGRLGYDLPLNAWLSASASYSLLRDSHAHLDQVVWRHGASLGAEALLGRRWVLTADAEALLSSEERVLQIFAALAFHL